MKNQSNHPETDKPAFPHLSFDGCGINGRDAYRTRVATFTEKRGEVAKHYGPMFAAAPDTLAALKNLVKQSQLTLERLEALGEPCAPFRKAVIEADACAEGQTK